MNHLKNVKEIGKTMKKEDAGDWVDKYQKENPKATFGWLYGCDILETLLKYENSCGIWFFKGINDAGEERLVMYPADKEGNLLDNKIKSIGAMTGDDDDDLPANDSVQCPTHCP